MGHSGRLSGTRAERGGRRHLWVERLSGVLGIKHIIQLCEKATQNYPPNESFAKLYSSIVIGFLGAPKRKGPTFHEGSIKSWVS